jgi:hypothetical protein
MPWHHALAKALHAYIAAAGIAEERRGSLFRIAHGHIATSLSDRPMIQPDAWRMIRQRADAGIWRRLATIVFGQPGIIAYLTNGGVLEHSHTGERDLDALHWGFVPNWTKDLKAAQKPINARAETVATSGMFRASMAEQRWLVPAGVLRTVDRAGRQATVRH